MASEDVYAVALNVLSATLDASSKTDAILDAHNVLRELDDVALRRVAGCLAVEAVWSGLPRTLAQTMPGRNHDAGLFQAAWMPAVRHWVDQIRLEVAWQVPERSEEAAS